MRVIVVVCVDARNFYVFIFFCCCNFVDWIWLIFLGLVWICYEWALLCCFGGNIMSSKLFCFVVLLLVVVLGIVWCELVCKVEDFGYSILYVFDYYVDAVSNGG